MSSSYDVLNKEQREAVETTEGPLLILAGAGSGKTRVLTYRIAALIEDKNVDPWNILAITFTNKAAGEMKERVMSLVAEGGDRIWVSTFHSMCVRILRRYADRIGYSNDFFIYDTDDQKAVAKKVLKNLNANPREWKERTLLSAISSIKNHDLDPDRYFSEHKTNPKDREIAKMFKEYQRILMENDAMDFDDLLLNTVQLFRAEPEVLGSYQERFHYIHVDEYQDTNGIQFELVRLLSQKYRNLCVVGDDDQSIYKFRGATITNILGFEEAFPGAKVIRLEQNYRSTMNILECANNVIENNRGRKAKRLWSDLGEGARTCFTLYPNGHTEAENIIDTIQNLKDQGSYNYKDFAILYRMNAQSRILEEACINRAKDVPYKLIGGINFYQRAEIKDILSYLRTICSAKDELAVRRIINVPRRGIGATTLDRVAQAAEINGVSFFEMCGRTENIPGIGKPGEKVRAFYNQIMAMRTAVDSRSVAELIDLILETTNYEDEFDNLDEEQAEAKRENLEELRSKAVEYWSQNGEDASLSGFLAEVALVADIDNLDNDADRITMMTMHGAKGLEFPCVFIVGMEDNVFPSYRALTSEDRTDLEEERRLCYVGITRAKERLWMSAAKRRILNGNQVNNEVSQFVNEIPRELLDWKRYGQPEVREFSGKTYGRDFSSSEKTDMKYDGFVAQNEGTHAAFPSKRTYFSGQKASSKNASNPGFGKAVPMGKAETLPYGIGDRVRHARFGEGTVLEITNEPRDWKVKVNFDNDGIKAMFAGFAKLEKV